MPLDRVQQVARGRVWTGADAKDRGLVDELGGFWTAVDEAKRLSGIPAATRVTFRPYPAPRGLFGELARLGDRSTTVLRAVNTMTAILESPLVQAMLGVIHAGVAGEPEFRAAGLPN